MTDAHPEYRVEGYDNVQPEYDQPYLRGADFNPNVVFKNAGDPDKQAEHQVELVKDLPVEHFYVNPVSNPDDPTYPQTVDPGAVPYAVASGDTESKGEKIARLKREIEALENQPDLEPHQPNGALLYPHKEEMKYDSELQEQNSQKDSVDPQGNVKLDADADVDVKPKFSGPADNA